MAAAERMDGVWFWPASLRAMEAHARHVYPDECCGLVLRRPHRERIRRIRNIQDELHAREPDRYPRTARIAYFMDPQALLEVYRAIERDGSSLVAIYHSHPDHEAYFSQEDRERAMLGDVPLYPGTAYLVISVRAGSVADRKAFRWHKDKQDFVEAPIVPRAFARRRR